MKPHERIIRSRGEVPGQERRDMPTGDGEPYEAYAKTEGFPQMGFSVFCRNRQRHVFFYHNMDNLDLVEQGDDEFVRFTHRGKAVTMRGRDLHGLVEAVIAHTLQAIYEYDEAIYDPIQRGERVIDRIAVTTLPGAVPDARKPADDPGPGPLSAQGEA